MGSDQDGGLFGRDVLRYRSGDWEITLDTWTEVGGDDSTTYTRMRAPFVNKDVLSLKIYRAGLFAPVGPFLGIQDIQIGDPYFDENFVIQGNNHTKIRWLLGDATLKELMQRQPDLCLEIRHDDGTWDDKDLLIFKCRGVLKDETLLKKLFDLFCTALARLAQMDSSSRQAIHERVTPVYKSRTDGHKSSATSPNMGRSRSAELMGTFSRSQPQIVWSGTSVSRLAIASSRLRGTDLHRVPDATVTSGLYAERHQQAKHARAAGVVLFSLASR